MTMADATSEVHEASDGRRWMLRRARPTDARALVNLFGSVRAEGRWLATPPSAVSEPSESYFVGEMIRSGETLVLVAETDGDVVGNVLVSVEQSSVSDHIGDRLDLTFDDLGGLQLGPNPNAPQGTTQNLYQGADNVTWVRGNHTLKFGTDFRKSISQPLA